jgi:hypothetical protein
MLLIFNITTPYLKQVSLNITRDYPGKLIWWRDINQLRFEHQVMLLAAKY